MRQPDHARSTLFEPPVMRGSSAGSCAGTKPLWQSAGTLAAITAIGQGVLVALSPLITRLYTPEAFGVYASFSALVLVLGAGSSLRYNVGITLPSDEAAASELMGLSFGFTLFFTLVLAAVLFAATATCQRLLPPGFNTTQLWLLLAGVLAAGLTETLSFGAMRSRRFSSLALSRVVQSAGLGGLQALAAAGASCGLLLADVLARTIAAGCLLISTNVIGRLRSLSLPSVVARAAKDSRFPGIMLPASMLNILALQIPFLVLPLCFGSSSAGQYFLGYRVLILPISVVGTAVSQVYFSEAGAAQRTGREFGAITGNLAVALVALYAPIYLSILAAGPELFALAFGPAWREAGCYAQVLAPMSLVWATASPLGAALIVGNRLKESLAYTFLELVVKISAIGIGVHFESLILTAALFCLTGLLLCSIAIARFLRASRADTHMVLRRVVVLLAVNAPGYFALAIGKAARSPMLLAAGAAIAITVTYALSWRVLRERLPL